MRLIEIFQLADLHGVEINPLAMRAAKRDAKLIDGHRRDARANAFFLDVLTSPRDPELVLRWMNEAGVFGRFVPDFGRVVAQMQFDMCTTIIRWTSIRSAQSGCSAGSTRRAEGGPIPLSSAIIKHIISRRVLYVCVLLVPRHRQGARRRPFDPGAEVAERLCPRFGLSARRDGGRWRGWCAGTC